jgi:hypothetical protein
MRLRLAAAVAVLAAGMGAVALAADRPPSVSVVGGLPGGTEVAGDVALDGHGDMAVAVAPQRAAGILRVAEHRAGGGRAVTVVRRGVKAAGVAVAYDRTLRPVVAWAAPTGLFSAAGGGPWAVQRLAVGRADAVAAAALSNGELLVAGLVAQGSRDRLLVFTGASGRFVRRDLGPVVRSAVLQAAPFFAGYALLADDLHGGLRLFTLSSPTAPAVPLSLGVRQGDGRLAEGPDGTLHVLYGGVPLGARTGRLTYAALRGRTFIHRVLQRSLPCDRSAFLIGVGFLRKAPRLLWGEGCDIGWSVTDVRGHVTVAGQRPGSESFPLAATTAAGHVAVLEHLHRPGHPDRLAVATFR